MKTIYKAGAIIFNDQGQILIAHKRGKPSYEFIVPGGKIESLETAEDALHREIMEELGTIITHFEPYANFEAKAIYDDLWLKMLTYKVVLKNTPVASGEIDHIAWVGKDFDRNGYTYASILGKQLLPKLRNEGLLK